MPYQFPKIIDSTILTSFRSCEKKAQYTFFHNLGSQHKSIHLHFGGAFAVGMEHSRKAFFVQGKSQSESIVTGINKALDYYGNFDEEAPPHKSPKSYAKLIEALDGYFREWPLGEDGLTPYNGREGIEFTFAIPIPGTEHPDSGDPIMYGGRFDLLGEYQSLPTIVDEKTASSFGENWISQWVLRNQFLGYTWATRQFGIAAQQALVRGIAIQVKEIKYLQAPVSYPDFMLRRWYEQLLIDLYRMVNAYKTGVFSFDFADACTAYGGCQFQDLCKSKDPTEWFSMFSQRNWDPLKKDPEA